MSLFRSTTPEPPASGREVLRSTLKTRSKKAHALTCASKEIGVNLARLDRFVEANGDLNPAELDALAKYLFVFAGYDEARDLIVNTAKTAATPLCAGHPPRFERKPDFVRPATQTPARAPKRWDHKEGWAD